MRVQPADLPKAPAPDTITLGIRFQPMSFVGTQTFILEHAYSWRSASRLPSPAPSLPLWLERGHCSFISVFPSPAGVTAGNYWFLKSLSPARPELCLFHLRVPSDQHPVPQSAVTRSVGNSLAVQWLGLGALTAEGPGSIPSRGTKIPRATRPKKKRKNKRKKTNPRN